MEEWVGGQRGKGVSKDPEAGATLRMRNNRRSKKGWEAGEGYAMKPKSLVGAGHMKD